MKEETLEEAAESYDAKQTILDFGKPYNSTNRPYAKAFIEGAKWQQENSYSEKDMIGFAKFFTQYTFIDNTLVGDIYALDETGNHPACTIAELISIWKKKQIQSHNL